MKLSFLYLLISAIALLAHLGARKNAAAEAECRCEADLLISLRLISPGNLNVAQPRLGWSLV